MSFFFNKIANGNFVEKKDNFCRQTVLKLILKSPRLVPFGANMTQYGAKPDIQATEVGTLYFAAKQSCAQRLIHTVIADPRG